MTFRATVLLAFAIGAAAQQSVPAITAHGITNAASFLAGPLAPGEIIVLFGSNLGPATLAVQTPSNNRYGTTLAGTQVSIGRTAAPLLYTSATQVSAIVPFEVAGLASVPVQVTYYGAPSATVSMPVAAASPALWAANASGSGPGAVLNQDGTLNSATNPAATGSVITLFGTGAGVTAPASQDGGIASGAGGLSQSVSVTVGGIAAPGILYAGPAPDEVAGVMQIDVTVPSNMHSGAAFPVVLASGNNVSPAAITVAVHALGPTGGFPTATSLAAAAATAQDNGLCTAITPFYWEIGDKTGALASGSQGTNSSGNPVLATTPFSIASASKWIYGTYVVQLRGSATALTAQDIPFLHFTSGYTNMGSDVTGSQCPSTDSPDTVNVCLALTNPANGLLYSYQDPATTGRFDYDSGHLENHASQYGGLGAVRDTALGGMVGGLLGTNLSLTYTEPLLAGGIYTNAATYTQVLRNIVNGSLFMHDALGTNPVCTRPSAPGCNAVYSPIPEAWHYSLAHWVEDDPATNGDGAFSSAGAFGFYPWIEASKAYYGVVARQQAAQNAEQNGYASAKCGRLIRRAWDTGVEQTGTIPQ